MGLEPTTAGATAQRTIHYATPTTGLGIYRVSPAYIASTEFRAIIVYETQAIY